MLGVEGSCSGCSLDKKDYLMFSSRLFQWPHHRAAEPSSQGGNATAITHKICTAGGRQELENMCEKKLSMQ